MDFEKKLKKLEDIVASMETGELSLEQSLKSFEDGIRLSKECHIQLDEAEKKVHVLLDVNKNGEAVTEAFNPGVKS